MADKHSDKIKTKPVGAKAWAGFWPRIFLGGIGPYIWLAVVVLLLYSRTLWFGFTFFDDDNLILKSSSKIGNLQNIWPAFTGRLNKGTTPFYRPLLDMSFIINYAISSLSPWGYHLINLFLHLGACLLLYGFLVKVGLGLATALIATAVFAVHPLNTSAVAWIPGRNDVLLAIFALPMLASFIAFSNRPRPATLALNLLLYGACLQTKEAGVLIPAVCLSYTLFNDRRSFRKSGLWGLVTAWFIISIAWYWARSKALGFSPELQTSRLMPATYLPDVLGSYLGKAFFTSGLSPVAVLTNSSVVWGLAAAGLLVGIAVWGGLRNRGKFLFGLAWMVLMTSPSLVSGSFVPLALEHRFYLPLMGLLVALSQLVLVHLNRKWKIAAALLLVAFAAGRSFSYSADFRDRETFWSAAEKKSPGNALVHYNLGVMHQEKGQLQQAVNEYHAALRLSPDYAAVFNSLGTVEQALGRPHEAERSYLKALELRPKFTEARCNLGSIYYAQGRMHEAEFQFRQCIRENPGLVSPHNSLGSVFYQTGRLDSASGEFRKAIELDPGLAEGHNNLGSVFLAEGLLTEAEAEYHKALLIKPSDLLAVLNLSQLYITAGKLSRAEELLRTAAGAEPGQYLFHEQLSYVYYLQQKYSLSVESYDRALALGAVADPRTVEKLKPFRNRR